MNESLTFKGNQTPQQVNSQIQRFNELQVPYGTIFKIYSGHPQLFSIEGPVRDKLEDYSDKVQNPENLVNTVFKITEAGLKAIYVPASPARLPRLLRSLAMTSQEACRIQRGAMTKPGALPSRVIARRA